MLAYAMKRQENERMASYQAWMTEIVKAKENRGSEKKPRLVPRYKKFKDLYDEEYEFRRLFEEVKPKPKKLSLADKNLILSRKREEG